MPHQHSTIETISETPIHCIVWLILCTYCWVVYYKVAFNFGMWGEPQSVLWNVDNLALKILQHNLCVIFTNLLTSTLHAISPFHCVWPLSIQLVHFKWLLKNCVWSYFLKFHNFNHWEQRVNINTSNTNHEILKHEGFEAL